MKSKAQIKTHPVHPILVAFPIAFFVGTFVFDLLALFGAKPILWQVGYYLELAGIAAAIVAAVPGIIDYKYTVPPDSSASKRAVRHGLLNTIVLLIFIAAFFIRQEEYHDVRVVLLEAAGALVLTIAGWMGGTLVHRNQIGVYNRYANGGKWSELRVSESDGLIEAGNPDDLKQDQMKLLIAGGKRIAIGRTAIGYVAFDDRCSHKGGSLAGGTMMCDKVQCPWHGSQFQTDTGEVTAGPAKEPIRCYPVLERNGKLYVRL